MRRANCGLIVVSCLLAAHAFAESFFAPSFEKLDLQALKTEVTALPETVTQPLEVLRLIQGRFFWGEALNFSGKIHERNEVWAPLGPLCEKQLSEGFTLFKDLADRSQAEFTCALYYSEQVRDTHPLRQVKIVQKIDQLLVLATTHGGAEATERHYTIGRVFHRLPRNMGRRVGKSLFALQLLHRMKPQVASVLFWLGYAYQIHGNEEQARLQFDKALMMGDSRSQLWLGGHYKRHPEKLDGLSSGWSPQLLVSPTLGFGIGLNLYDDRLFDTERLGSLSLNATTKGNFSARVEYADRETLTGVSLLLSAFGGQIREEYFGLGMAAAKTNLTALKNRRLEVGLEARKFFLDYFYFGLGWRVGTHQVSSAVGGSFSSDPLPSKSQATHTGVTGTFGFDSRDSRVAPRRGALLEVSLYAPATTLGSDFGFEKWLWRSQVYLPLGLKHNLAFALNAAMLSGNAPYGVFHRLGQDLDLPGVRAGRFQERNAMGAMVEYRWELFNILSTVAFGTLGSVADTFPNLFQGTLGAGGGIGLIFHPSYYHKPSVRLDAGIFASEFVLQASAGVKL